MKIGDKLRLMGQIKAANKRHVREWKARRSGQTAMCNDCASKGWCVDYQHGASCVHNQKTPKR